ncbi:MAG: GNAT family N-acetyltransferase [Actinomycetales bacterium]|nr:GNAT family N-acetyltransferase [Actinomycetales bacterium]
MSMTIESMIWGHIDEVLGIEQQCFGADAWTEAGFWSELEGVPGLKDYVVALGVLGGAVADSTGSGDGEDETSAAGVGDTHIHSVVPIDDTFVESTAGGGAAAAHSSVGGCAVLGYAGVQFIAPEAEVLTVAVHPQAQRRGIGRVLVAHLEQTAAARGCGLLHLEVEDANSAARGMYAALGYQEVGRRTNYYGLGRDAVLMSKHLAAPTPESDAAESTRIEVGDV